MNSGSKNTVSQYVDVKNTFVGYLTYTVIIEKRISC